jgi:Zn-dependent protease
MIQPSAGSLGRAPARAATARGLVLFGAPVRADVSCAFGVGLGAWTFADTLLPAAAEGHPPGTYWAGGALTALLLLLSLGLHEAAHCLAARRAGVGVRMIELSLFGGATAFCRPPDTPGRTLGIALAGPAASLAVAVAAALVHIVLVEAGADALAAAAAAILAVGNLGLALLNLLPALPLDGGHVLRALLWRVTRRPAAATRAARVAGRGVGGALLTMAVFSSASGDAAIALWAALLGCVIHQNSGPPGPPQAY